MYTHTNTYTWRNGQTACPPNSLWIGCYMKKRENILNFPNRWQHCWRYKNTKWNLNIYFKVLLVGILFGVLRQGSTIYHRLASTHYVARLVSNSGWSSCLSLQNAEIIGLCHHALLKYSTSGVNFSYTNIPNARRCSQINLSWLKIIKVLLRKKMEKLYHKMIGSQNQVFLFNRLKFQHNLHKICNFKRKATM